MRKNIFIGIGCVIFLSLVGVSIYELRQAANYKERFEICSMLLNNERKMLQESANKQKKDLLSSIEMDLISQPIIGKWSFIKTSLIGEGSDKTKNERIIGYLSGRILVLETPHDLSLITSPNTTVNDLKKIANKLIEPSRRKILSEAFKEGVRQGANDALLDLHKQLTLPKGYSGKRVIEYIKKQGG